MGGRLLHGVRRLLHRRRGRRHGSGRLLGAGGGRLGRRRRGLLRVCGRRLRDRRRVGDVGLDLGLRLLHPLRHRREALAGDVRDAVRARLGPAVPIAGVYAAADGAADERRHVEAGQALDRGRGLDHRPGCIAHEI